MVRLPILFGDEGKWGEILNEYLLVSHNGTGELKPGVVSTTQLATPGAPTSGQVLSFDGSSLVWVPAASGGGVSDHGALTGLGDDDHPQYLNTARGDARYYTQTQVNTALSSKADTTDPRFTDERTPSDGSITPDKLSSNPPASGNVLTYNGTNFEWISASSGVTNLSTTRTGSTVTVLSDTGTDATIAAADTTNAGIMSAADKTKLDGIAAGAEANDGANVGTAGVGVYKQKSGSTLQFKNINAGSNKISITDNTANDEVDVDVIEGNINLANTSGDISQARVTNLTTSLSNKIETSLINAPNGVAGLDGSGQLSSAAIPPRSDSHAFSRTGALSVETGVHRLYNDSGITWTITSVRASVGTAPAGSSIIIDIHKNATTIFTNQANRPSIAAAANTSGRITTIDVTTLTNGEYLTVDVDQVGSTTTGSDLTVQVEVRY